MAWWTGKKDEEIPAELRDKKPEELVKAVQDAARASELETTATEAQNENERLRQQIRELEANQRPATQTQTRPTSVLADEDAAFNERLKPIQDLALGSAALSARSAARESLSARDRYVWNKYAAEIEQIMQRESLERRAIPQNWIAALTFVKGIKVDDIAKPDFFSELSTPDTSIGGPRHDSPSVSVDKLTDAEEAACKRMRIDPKVYLEQRNKMRGDNPNWVPGQHAN